MRTCTLLARRQVPSVQGLAYPFGRAVTALRQFAHARHVGKILLHLPEPDAVSGGTAGQTQVSAMGASQKRSAHMDRACWKPRCLDGPPNIGAWSKEARPCVCRGDGW